MIAGKYELMSRVSTSVQIGVYSWNHRLWKKITKDIRKKIKSSGLEYKGPWEENFNIYGDKKEAKIFFTRFSFSISSNKRAKNIVQEIKNLESETPSVDIQVGVGTDSYKPSITQTSKKFKKKVRQYTEGEYKKEKEPKNMLSEKSNNEEDKVEINTQSSSEVVDTPETNRVVDKSEQPNDGHTQSEPPNLSRQTENNSTEIDSYSTDRTLKELRKRAEKAAQENPMREQATTVSSQYRRSGAIREYARARADGICECCGEPAPFNDKNSQPYLEVHHINELGEGGADSPDMVAAICPTCHTQIHYGENGSQLNQTLIDDIG